jgi:short subunit dehydrogenase-like uncharacterized protein
MISRSCIVPKRYPGEYDPASMTATETQRGPIVVYGATGYTGRLVAAELARRGADFVLAGRSRERLAGLAAQLDGAAYAVAPLDDPDALRTVFEPGAVVISCAGPFVVHGEPVVRAAIESGCGYLDTTGEQPFIQRVFEVHGPAAEAAAVPLVPAMGFDYAPGDMIAALTCGSLGQVDDVLLAYSVRSFGPSRGTAASAVGQVSGGDVEWRDGALVAASQSVRRPDHDFGGEIGVQRMTRYPAGEHITVPRHVETRNVHTALTATTSAGHPKLAPLVPFTMPVLQALLRTRARGAIEGAVARLPEGPSIEDRKRAGFTIDCDVTAGRTSRRGVIEGSDVYGLTAVTIAEGALRLAAPGCEHSGALAPSEAFEPADFLAAIAHAGIGYEIDDR